MLHHHVEQHVPFFFLHKRLCTGSRVTSTGVYGGEWRFLFQLNLLLLFLGFFNPPESDAAAW